MRNINSNEYIIKQTEDLLKGSQEELISSVEASQEISQHFMDDTPLNDETPMCDDKIKRNKKSWVKQLNDKLENIEAVACKNQVFEVIKKLCLYGNVSFRDGRSKKCMFRPN